MKKASPGYPEEAFLVHLKSLETSARHSRENEIQELPCITQNLDTRFRGYDDFLLMPQSLMISLSTVKVPVSRVRVPFRVV